MAWWSLLSFWSVDVLFQCQKPPFLPNPPSDTKATPRGRLLRDVDPILPQQWSTSKRQRGHICQAVVWRTCEFPVLNAWWLRPNCFGLPQYWGFVWLRCDYPSIEDFCWLRYGFGVNNWEEMKPQDWSFLVSIHPFWEDQKWFKPCFIWSSQRTSNLLRSFLENILF